MFPPPALQPAPQAPGGSVMPEQAPGGPQGLSAPGQGGPPPHPGAPGMGGPPPLPMPSPAPPVTIDAVMGLLRDQALRRFRIDIEVDSTITGDESQERQDRTQLIQSVTQLVEAWGPIVQAQPVMANLAGELMMFGVRAFRVGRTLEEVIEETVDKLEAAAGQPKMPPQPSPDELVKLQGIQAKTQAEIQKAQLDVQAQQAAHEQTAMQHRIDAAALERQAQLDQANHIMQMQKMQADAAAMQQKLQADAVAHEHKLELMKTQHEHALKQAKQPRQQR